MRHDRFAAVPAAAILFIVTVFSAGRAMGDDADPSWPQFHGPNRDNLSAETELLKRWPISGPKLLWTVRGIGSGYSSVALAHGLIYTTGNIGDDTVITALDLNGQMQWQYKNGPAWKDPKPGSRATPTIDGDRLYHKSPHGELVCLGAITGARNWGFNILKTFGAENIRWAVSESLLVDGQQLICCPGGPQTAVVALDKMNSSTLWKSPSTRELAGYASPSLGVVGELRIIATMTARACIGVNADTGELLWHERHVTPWDENICMPIIHDGCVFYSTGHRVGGVKLKLNVDGDKVTTDVLWRSRELDNHHGGVILLDGYLYGSGHRGGWICVDWETGETKYNEPGVGKGSLTSAEGMLYTLSERSRVGLVPATPERHELISQFRLPAGPEGPSWAHPVVCGGRLYIRHDDYLFAYDIHREPRFRSR